MSRDGEEIGRCSVRETNHSNFTGH